MTTYHHDGDNDSAAFHNSQGPEPMPMTRDLLPQEVTEIEKAAIEHSEGKYAGQYIHFKMGAEAIAQTHVPLSVAQELREALQKIVDIATLCTELGEIADAALSSCEQYFPKQ